MIAFRVSVRAPEEDLATAALWEAGTVGIEVQAAGAGDVALLAYFEPRTALDARLRRAFELLPHARLEPVDVPQVDWVERFRAGFRASRVGGFWVTPPWLDAAPPPGLRRLIVDPGRAFGTGSHESTRLCLHALESTPLGRGRRVLDVGTGNGILAVAACLLGFAPVVAADLDPEATSAARRHARLNAVRVAVVQGDGGRAFRERRFALILANLTAPLLLERRDELAAAAEPGATLILAGFLAEELASIRAAYAALGPLAVLRESEWAAAIVGATGEGR